MIHATKVLLIFQQKMVEFSRTLAMLASSCYVSIFFKKGTLFWHIIIIQMQPK